MATSDRSVRRLALLAPWQRPRREDERVTAALADLELAGYRSLHRVDTGYGAIDHAVFGPGGIFAVQTEHWTGLVRAKRDRLMCGFRDEERTRRRAVWSAACLEHWLEEDGVGIPVSALLVPVDAQVEDDRIDLADLTVLPLGALTAFLGDRPRVLSPTQIERAADAMAARGASVRGPA